MTQEPSGETQGAREEVRWNEGRGRVRNERGLCLPTRRNGPKEDKQTEIGDAGAIGVAFI